MHPNNVQGTGRHGLCLGLTTVTCALQRGLPWAIHANGMSKQAPKALGQSRVGHRFDLDLHTDARM
jgi:hypothetical protein